MDMQAIFGIASGISTPLALSGLTMAVLFFVLRQILSMDIFTSVGDEGTRDIIKRILNILFVLALAAMVLGFLGYALVNWVPKPG